MPIAARCSCWWGPPLPLIPYAVWLAQLDLNLIAARSVAPKAVLTTQRIAAGAAAFVVGLVLVFLPWIVVVGAFARRCPRMAKLPPDAMSATRLALITALAMVVLMVAIFSTVALLGMAPLGVNKFAIHYLFPVCLFAALGIAGLVAPRVDPERFAPRLALTTLVAAIAIFVIKLGSFYVVPPRLEATNLIPYAQARRGAHASWPGACTVRDPLAARRRQSRDLSAPSPCPVAERQDRAPLPMR